MSVLFIVSAYAIPQFEGIEVTPESPYQWVSGQTYKFYVTANDSIGGLENITFEENSTGTTLNHTEIYIGEDGYSVSEWIETNAGNSFVSIDTEFTKEGANALSIGVDANTSIAWIYVSKLFSNISVDNVTFWVYTVDDNDLTPAHDFRFSIQNSSGSECIGAGVIITFDLTESTWEEISYNVNTARCPTIDKIRFGFLRDDYQNYSIDPILLLGENASFTSYNRFYYQLTTQVENDTSFNYQWFGENTTSTINMSSQYTYVADGVAPVLTFESSINDTHTNATPYIELNFSYVETNPDSCWYSVEGIENYTLSSCTTNGTEIWLINGTGHYIDLYMNDTLGNLGTQRVYYSYECSSRCDYIENYNAHIGGWWSDFSSISPSNTTHYGTFGINSSDRTQIIYAMAWIYFNDPLNQYRGNSSILTMVYGMGDFINRTQIDDGTFYLTGISDAYNNRWLHTLRTGGELIKSYEILGEYDKWNSSSRQSEWNDTIQDAWDTVYSNMTDDPNHYGPGWTYKFSNQVADLAVFAEIYYNAFGNSSAHGLAIDCFDNISDDSTDYLPTERNAQLIAGSTFNLLAPDNLYLGYTYDIISDLYIESFDSSFKTTINDYMNNSYDSFQYYLSEDFSHQAGIASRTSRTYKPLRQYNFVFGGLSDVSKRFNEKTRESIYYGASNTLTSKDANSIWIYSYKNYEEYNTSYLVPVENDSSVFIKVLEDAGISVVKTNNYTAYLGSRYQTPSGCVIADLYDHQNNIHLAGGKGQSPDEYGIGVIGRCSGECGVDSFASNYWDSTVDIDVTSSVYPFKVECDGLLTYRNQSNYGVKYFLNYTFYHEYIDINVDFADAYTEVVISDMEINIWSVHNNKTGTPITFSINNTHKFEGSNSVQVDYEFTNYHASDENIMLNTSIANEDWSSNDYVCMYKYAYNSDCDLISYVELYSNATGESYRNYVPSHGDRYLNNSDWDMTCWRITHFTDTLIENVSEFRIKLGKAIGVEDCDLNTGNKTVLLDYLVLDYNSTDTIDNIVMNNTVYSTKDIGSGEILNDDNFYKPIDEVTFESLSTFNFSYMDASNDIAWGTGDNTQLFDSTSFDYRVYSYDICDPPDCGNWSLNMSYDCSFDFETIDLGASGWLNLIGNGTATFSDSRISIHGRTRESGSQSSIIFSGSNVSMARTG